MQIQSVCTSATVAVVECCQELLIPNMSQLISIACRQNQCRQQALLQEGQHDFDCVQNNPELVTATWTLLHAWQYGDIASSKQLSVTCIMWNYSCAFAA